MNTRQHRFMRITRILFVLVRRKRIFAAVERFLRELIDNLERIVRTGRKRCRSPKFISVQIRAKMAVRIRACRIRIRAVATCFKATPVTAGTNIRPSVAFPIGITAPIVVALPVVFDMIAFIAIPAVTRLTDFFESVCIPATVAYPRIRTHFIGAVPFVAGCAPVVVFAGGELTPHISSGTVIAQFAEPAIVTFHTERIDGTVIPAVVAVERFGRICFPAQSTTPDVVSAVRLSVSSSRITGTTPVVRTTFTPREVFSTLRACPETTALKPENILKLVIVSEYNQIMRAGFVTGINFLTHFAIPSSATAGTKRVPSYPLCIAGRAIPARFLQTRFVCVMQSIAEIAIPVMVTLRLRIITIALPTEPELALLSPVRPMGMLLPAFTIPAVIATVNPIF